MCITKFTLNVSGQQILTIQSYNPCIACRLRDINSCLNLVFIFLNISCALCSFIWSMHSGIVFFLLSIFLCARPKEEVRRKQIHSWLSLCQTQELEDFRRRTTSDGVLEISNITVFIAIVAWIWNVNRARYEIWWND